jgi:predicted transcriptional regulator
LIDNAKRDGSKITQSVVLTGDQITRLQELARETGKSVSSVTRDAVTRFLQAEVKKE